MKGLKEIFKGKRRKGVFAVAAVIVVAAVVSLAIIVGNADNDSGKAIDGSTIMQTNEDGETVVVATDKNGATVVYETDKNGKLKESKKSSTKAANAAKAKPATTAAATSPPTTKATQAQNICYVTVEGYCSSKAISLQGGDTAYSVLTRTGANVSAENSGYGVYVKGINGRMEKSEGRSSGWMYSVNGSTPGVSAGSYGVNNGDSVSWYFVH